MVDNQPSGRYSILMAKKKQVDKILDAAGAVVHKHGIASLTIDGVAEKVGMSKGGVLHHYRTKDLLIEAMVQRTANQWREGFHKAYENTKEGPGRSARALLANCLSDAKAWTDELRDGSSALFAALAYDPKLIAPMRKVYRELHQHLADDDLPPGVAVTVLAAIDGMWLWWVLGLRKLDQSLVEQVRRVLESIVEELK